MIFRVSLNPSLLLLVAACALSGCVPAAPGPAEETNEAQFLAAKSRMQQMDYPGAIEAFEKALQANPQNASAHFELACLYEQNQADPAAAIYHYDHFLKLRPDSEKAEIVRQRITTCKQDLARTVSLGPLNEKMQRDFDQAAVDKRKLQADLEACRALIAHLQALTNAAALPPLARAQLLTPRTGTGAAPVARVGAATAVARSHTVQAGETPTVIARKYGVKLSALMEANPGLNPQRMRVGQTLVIPGR